MSALIELIVTVFRFILELILDIILTAVFLVSLIGIWRIPFWFEFELRSRNEYRFFCLACFGSFLLDVITFPVAIIVQFTWRAVVMDKWIINMNTERFYTIEKRGVVWLQAALFLYDIPFIFMGLFIHITFWRIPQFYSMLWKEGKENGVPLLRGLEGWETATEFRSIIFFSFLEALLDILILPMALVVLVTGYRIPSVQDEWKIIAASKADSRTQLLKKKGIVCIQCLLVFVDFPFILMGLLTILMVWHAKNMIEDLQEVHDAGGRRCVAAVHFALSFREWLFVPLFVVVLASIYRGFFAVTKMMSEVSRWADTTPQIKVTKAIVEFPSRGTGLIVRVSGTKDSSFSLGRDEKVKLYVRNSSFWSAVEQTFGKAAGVVGSTLLPLSLTPNYFDPSTVAEGTTDVDLTIDFATHYPCSTIQKNANKFFAGTQLWVQVEFGSHSGTLFNFEVKLSDLAPGLPLTPLDAFSGISAETRKGKRFCDVFWEVVLLEFLWLIVDLAGVLLFILLHFFVHRIYRVYNSGCEGPERKQKRRAVSEMHLVVSRVKQRANMVQQVLTELEKNIRETIPQSHDAFRYGNYLQTPESARNFIDILHEHVERLTTLGLKEASELLQSIISEVTGDWVAYRHYLEKVFGSSSCDSLFHFDKNGNPRSRRGEIGLSQREGSLYGAINGGHNEDDDLQRAIMASLEDGTAPQPKEQPLKEVETREKEVETREKAEGEEQQEIKELEPWQLLARAAASTQSHVKKLLQVQSQVERDFCATKWTGGKDGWPGFRAAVFTEVAQLGYDIAAIFCFTVVLLSVYRTFPLISSLLSSTNWRKTCVMNFAEIFVDVLYLFKILLVFFGIRGIFTLPADLFIYLIQKPSYQVARQVINHHLELLMVDIVKLLSLIFAWDALRLIVASSVFGIFSPGVMLESAFSRWELDRSSNKLVVRNAGKSTAAFLLLLSTTWMIGLPLYVALSVQKSSYTTAAWVYFVPLGVAILLGILVAVAFRDPRIVSFRRAPVRFMAPTYHNISTFVQFVVEFVQLAAIVLSVCDRTTFGETGEKLADVSRYVFLIWGQDWAANGLPFGVYFSLSVALLFFLCSSMPIVMGDMLHWKKTGRLLCSPLWVGSMQFLGEFCQLTVVRNLALLFICDETTKTMLYCPESNCWQGGHRTVAILMMIAMIYYVPSSMMRNIKYDESICRGLEVVYPQLYKLFIRGPTAICACITLFLHNSPRSAMIVALITFAWCLAITVLYGPLFNQQERSCCSVGTMVNYRAATYASVLIASILMLVALGKSSVMWVLYAMLVAAVAVWLVAIVKSLLVRCKNDVSDDGIEDMRQSLLTMEDYAATHNYFAPEWRYRRSSWRSQVEHAVRLSSLCVLLKALERSLFAAMIAQTFIQARESWLKKVDVLVERCDQERDIDVLYDAESTDWAEMIVCCECGCCSHLSNERDESEVTTVNTIQEERLRVESMLECAMALKNAMNKESRLF